MHEPRWGVRGVTFPTQLRLSFNSKARVLVRLGSKEGNNSFALSFLTVLARASASAARLLDLTALLSIAEKDKPTRHQRRDKLIVLQSGPSTSITTLTFVANHIQTTTMSAPARSLFSSSLRVASKSAWRKPAQSLFQQCPGCRQISRTAIRRNGPQPIDDPSFKSLLDNPPVLVRVGGNKRHGPGLIVLGKSFAQPVIR